MANDWNEFMQVEGFDRLNEAHKLSEEESKNDPDEEPYRSKYKAREVLVDVKKKLENILESHPDDKFLRFYKAAFLLKLGSNYQDTEEISEGQDQMMKCLELLEDYKLDPDGASTYMNCLNSLSLLWMGRDKSDSALSYLQQAEKLFFQYKEDVGGAPKSYKEYLHRQVEDEERREHERSQHFENTYTHTLYYMAQVYSKKEEKEKAAVCCHTTLQRQLDEHKYDPLDWSLNAATLSQFYITVDDFSQARHCLASSEVIYQEAEIRDSETESEEQKEKLEQSKADIERCWVKYGLALLETSQEKLHEERPDENGSVPQEKVEDKKSFQRFNLEVTSHEEQIMDKYILDFTEARQVFLKVQQWINSAKTFYVFDGRCTDYIELTQDHSKAFKLLAFFEMDIERQCKMQKRRIDMLQEISNEINPQHYLLIQRQLLFELAETYSLMMELKFSIMEEEGGNPSLHALKKVNSLIHQSIAKYQEFLNSFKDGKPELPEKFPELDIRPALIAKFCMGRLYSKLIVPNVQEKIRCVQKTEECYKYFCDYCDKYPEAAQLVPQELQVCKEMVALLPVKMEKLRQEAEA